MEAIRAAKLRRNPWAHRVCFVWLPSLISSGACAAGVSRWNWRIELVRRQYSGNAYGVIAGIGLVSYVYVNPETEQFWLIYDRLFAPDVDGKTKLDHVADMLAQLAPRGIAYRTVLMDSWYATMALFKWLLAAGKTFYCPLKTRFTRLGATASSTTPAASSPTSRWAACAGRTRR